MAARPEARKLPGPYPESYGELEKLIKDTHEKIVKLNERDQKFHDIAPYCRWRYYKSIVNQYDKNGKLNVDNLQSLETKYEESRENPAANEGRPTPGPTNYREIKPVWEEQDGKRRLSQIQIKFEAPKVAAKKVFERTPVIRSEYIQAVFLALHNEKELEHADFIKNVKDQLLFRKGYITKAFNNKAKIDRCQFSVAARCGETLESARAQKRSYDFVCKQNHTLKNYERHVKRMEEMLIKDETEPKYTDGFSFGIKSSNHVETTFHNSAKEWMTGNEFSALDNPPEAHQSGPTPGPRFREPEPSTGSWPSTAQLLEHYLPKDAENHSTANQWNSKEENVYKYR